VNFILDGILNRDEAFPFYCFFSLSQPINTINAILTFIGFQSEGYVAAHSSSCAALHYAIFFSSYLQRLQTEVAQGIMALKGKYPA